MGFGGSGGGGGSISSSSDVALNTLANKNVLGYDSGSGKWTNQSLTGTAALANSGGEESFKTLSATSATTPLSLVDGNVFNVQLQANTTFAFPTDAAAGKACSFGLYLQQDATGNRTVAWPTSVKWPEGQAPTLTLTASSLDILVFESLDGGSNWHGSLVGTNFS